MSRLCVVTIFTRDLAAAERFYTDTIGLRVHKRYGPFIVEFEQEGPALILQQIATDGSTPTEPCTITGFATRDLAAEAKRLAAGGARKVGAAQPFPVGQFIAFTSPEGIAHEALQFDATG